MKDLTGETLGKYQVLERLGRGGMADVYRAYQPGMDRYVAIKVLHGHLSEDKGFIERFKREAQSVGTLRHPNIVQVIDFDAVGDEYYMVMEFIEGDTLKALLSRRGALPIGETITLMSKIADAVAYAHRAGMIHRDIKPANILMTASGDPILTDFGIAKILSATNLTASGVAIGTPAYMSPEAGRGEKIDERADIYSLGVMLYEMVTGTVPFDADTPWAVILKHINEPIPRPTAILPSLPQSMEKILLKSLAKAPADRYQTAADFRDALVKAGQALPTAQAARPVASSDSPTSTQVAQKTAPSAPASSRTGRLIFGAITVIMLIGAGAFYIVNQGVISNSPSAQTATAVALLPTNTATANATTAPTSTATTPATATTEPSATTPPTNTPTNEPTIVPSETTAPTVAPTIAPTEAPTSAPAATDIPAQTAVAVNSANTYTALTQQVTQLIRNGQLAEALDDVAKQLANDPQNYTLQWLNAWILMQHRDDATKLGVAKTWAETAIKDTPDRPEAYYVLAQYWGVSPQEDYQKALDLVTQAIDKGMTTLADAYIFHGTMLYYIGGSSDNILSDLGKAIALEPNNEEFYRRRGFYLLNDLYQLTPAKADLEHALTLSRNNIYEVNSALAWIYIQQNQPEDAFQLYRKSIEDDLVTDAAFLADGAIVAWQTNHTTEAEKWSSDAHAIDPNLSTAIYAQALVAWAKNDRETALKLLDQLAASSLPDDYNRSFLLTWYHLGRELEMDRAYILIELDRKDEAMAALKLAVDKYGQWIDPRLELAKLYVDKQDKASARDLLQQALQIATDQKDAAAREKILAMLKELGD